MQALRLYLAGPAGSGKSTVAAILVGEFGFWRVSMGDIVRRECVRMGLDPTRRNLQSAGDVLRGSVPHRLAAVAADTAARMRGPVVIEGVRLAAEARYLADRGYIGVRVEAPDALRMARIAARDGCFAAVPHHPTEDQAHVLSADLVLRNDTDDPRILRWSVRLTVARAVLRTAERVYRMAE